ncbi:uracil-DNA glycosylase family protein [Patescibacteria group bacterium]|nr:uracil-DNA glycosylase family protein [Patescibacteria group bacterium]
MLDSLQNKFCFDKIFVSFTPLIDNFKFGNEEKIEEIYKKTLIDDEFSMYFFSMKNFYKRILFLYYFTKVLGVKITQFVDDPLEADLTKFNEDNNRFYSYDNKQKNMKYFPFVEWNFVFGGYKKKLKKDFDFSFGMTSIMTKNKFRYNLIGEFLDNEENLKEENIKYNLFFKDKERNIKTFVNGFEYNEYLSRSKYTLTIPSYDVEEFSLIRFLEALDRDCVCFVHKNCYYKKGLINYPEILKIVERNLIVNNIKELIYKIKTLNYNKIIKEIKESYDWKKINSYEYYEKYMNLYGDEIFYSNELKTNNYDLIYRVINLIYNENFSYNEKTYKILKYLNNYYLKVDFSLDLNFLHINDLHINDFLFYSPFMFYKDTKNKEKRKKLINLYNKQIKKYKDEEDFLFGIGNGCLDDNCILVLGMAPGFYNNNKFDNISKPYKPSFYFSNTSKILKKGFFNHLNNIYFSNVSKVVFSKEKMNDKLYNSLYNEFKDILLKEIKILNPSIIIALGNNVDKFLTDNNIKHIKSYHPSYFLYQHSENKGIEYYKSLLEENNV